METKCCTSSQELRPPAIESQHQINQESAQTLKENEALEKQTVKERDMHGSHAVLLMEESDCRDPKFPTQPASTQEINRLQQHRTQPDKRLNWHGEESQQFGNADSTAGSDGANEMIMPASRQNDMCGSMKTSSDSENMRNLPSLKRRETKLMQKEAHPWEHIGITLGLPMILLFDMIVPCVIYYTWYDTQKENWQRQCEERYPNQKCAIPHPEFEKATLGYAIISFGFGELWILIARVWRLFLHREECAPLLSRNKWELDATCWVYAVAMLMALIPFVVGSSLEIPRLYLYSPSFLMGFLGILMVITICVPFKIPIGINSHARGSSLRPFIYYAAEDFIAVDGLQDREFRVRYNERYESNKMFRHFLWCLTLWWILGVCVYIGIVSVVIWTLDFHYAFGLSFGVLFSYIAVWAGVSVAWTRIEMKREHLAYEEGQTDC
jgi:hypothetical protein